MTKSRPKRPSADITRKKILLAAKQVFLAKGYDATYIKDIAKLAAVNTNLIFHHFTKIRLIHIIQVALVVSISKYLVVITQIILIF